MEDISAVSIQPILKANCWKGLSAKSEDVTSDTHEWYTQIDEGQMK